MTTDRGLGGVAINNPRLLSKEELIGGFVCRTALLERIAADLRTYAGSAAPHRLILGQRGMGKTSLLHRLRHRIDDDPELAGWLPLVFPEEQYNVDRLSVFWLNCLDALGDALEARGEPVDALDDAIDAMAVLPEQQRADKALGFITELARQRGQQLLLLVDNVDLVLDRLGTQEWAVREALSHDSRLTLIGASSKALESSYQYDKAFFDFFVVDELRGLDAEETQTLLLRLAERLDAPGVATVARMPERIEPIRALTGGNPRTLVLLYTILAEDEKGDARTDLEQLLDRCTPLYKARFEEVSAQAQKVLHELAMHWHPTGSGALAKRAGLKASVVSGQLDRLVKAGIVEKVPLGTDQGRSKRTGYQVAERFFNIWYLMRASRRVRRRITWLVEFLKLLHTPEERRSRARRVLGRDGRDAGAVETAFAYSQAVEDPGLRGALEHKSLSGALANPELRAAMKELFDFEGEDAGLKDRAERLRLLQEAKEAVFAWEGDWGELGGAGAFWELLGGSLQFRLDQKWWIALHWSDLSLQRQESVAQELKDESEEGSKVWGSRSWRCLQRLFREGYCSGSLKDSLPGALEAVEAWGDPIAPWVIAAVETDHRSWLDRLARLGLSEALALESSSPLWVWRADALARLGRHQEAENAYRVSLELSPRNSAAWFDLADLLYLDLERLEEAERAYRQVIEYNPSEPWAWLGLGCVLHDLRREEAGPVLRRSVRLDGSSSDALNALAWHLHLHGDPTEALTHSTRAVELAPDNPWFTHTHACCLIAAGKIPEARPFIHHVVTHDDPAFHDRTWSDTLHLFRLLIRAKHAATAVSWLEDWGLADRWLPLRTALQALAVNDEDVLLSVAPEVRGAARTVLEQLRADPA